MENYPLGSERPGISTGDPQAIEKMRARMREYEARREHMKAVNAYYKEHKTLDGCPGVTPEEAAKLIAGIKPDTKTDNRPYGHYVLDSVGGSIRSFRKRIAELEKRRCEPWPKGWRFDGGEVVIDEAQNCIKVILDERADTDRIIELKLGGFRMTSLDGPWVRQYTDRALDTARRLFPKKY